MIDLVFFDQIWKCLFTLSSAVTVSYSISMVGYAFIKRFVPNEKSKWFFNYHIFFTASSLAVGSIVLTHTDPELIAGCFNHYATTSNSYTITRLLAAGYFIAICLMLIFDCAKLFFAIHKHSRLLKIKTGTVKDILNSLTEQLKIKKSIDILLNETATSPYVWGLFRHSIVINPSLLMSTDKTHIRTVLSHELMHIKGYDSAWILLSHISKRIFFFNPLSYFFYSKHKLAVEMAADERAVEQCGIEPSNLLKSILEIAEHCTNKYDNHLLQVNASQEFTELKERIQSMINRRNERFTWGYHIFSVLSVVLSLTATAIQTNASASSLKSGKQSEELMCSQVRHEKVIENWLRIESPPNKCEIK